VETFVSFFFSDFFNLCAGSFRMSKPVADILQTFYMQLRDSNTSADGTPITARQLESLVRLAEARARVDLREEITAEDAKVNGSP
jgi:DNA helicase MCM8